MQKFYSVLGNKCYRKDTLEQAIGYLNSNWMPNLGKSGVITLQVRDNTVYGDTTGVNLEAIKNKLVNKLQKDIDIQKG
jgi:hypothetical protein